MLSQDSEPDGLWTTWHKNSQKETENHYKDGKLISQKMF